MTTDQARQVMRIVDRHVTAFARRHNVRYLTEDLRQEAIARSLMALPRYDAASGAELATFLHHHIHGAMIDLLRAESRQRDGVTRSMSVQDSDAVTLDYRAAAPGSWWGPSMPALLRAIGRLPDRERTVLVRTVLGDDRKQDVASDLGVSPSSVSLLLRSARRLLRPLL